MQLEAKQAELAPKTEALLALQARVDTIDTEARLLRDASSQAQRQLEQANNTAQGRGWGHAPPWEGQAAD